MHGNYKKKELFFLLFLPIASVLWAQSPPPSPAFISDGFVRVEGGTFFMGSPSREQGRDDDEGPQHQVTVSSFYMSRYEVTQKEYQEVMGTNPSGFKGDNLPVETVSWYDAVEYCNRRSLKEGLAPAYTVNILWWESRTVTWDRNADGYRLPTEAEWEYACRAGTTTAYNTGESINGDTGWYAANSGDTTHPVGQKPPNAWGLYDMHGNVWEWCWDWYIPYSSEAQIDPQAEPYEGAPPWLLRVRRGGGWYNSAEYLRSATRYVSRPHYHGRYLGFRVVRNAR
jgi:formylglycine-generating enzyme required for sulfatase activity